MHALLHSSRFARRRDSRGAYAAELYRYANGRVDEQRLRAWMTQRLMLDCGLGHAVAQALSDRTIV